jgi:hypothetical protein
MPHVSNDGSRDISIRRSGGRKIETKKNSTNIMPSSPRVATEIVGLTTLFAKTRSVLEIAALESHILLLYKMFSPYLGSLMILLF